MNIQEAKTELKNSIKAYLTKDKYNNYIIPLEKQRPIYLYGASGIGKTAIVYQVAEEEKLGFVSYSMTHHTRQTAIGLPVITDKKYEGNEYKVTLYTLSEILTSVYETNKKEGILFIDEINCVSETLLPILLQFLQYKKFGNHTLPEGWIIVTAGNPPEYNQSAFDFEIALLDRLKVIKIEPSYPVWKLYALENNVHPIIISFLDVHPNYFYDIKKLNNSNYSSNRDNDFYVTSRGWTDLSNILTVYELNNIEITENLIIQYINYPVIVSEFICYYNITKKFMNNDIIEYILENNYKKNDDNDLLLKEYGEMTSILNNIEPNEFITISYCLKNKIEECIIKYNIFIKCFNTIKDKIGNELKNIVLKDYKLEFDIDRIRDYINDFLYDYAKDNNLCNNNQFLEIVNIIKNYCVDYCLNNKIKNKNQNKNKNKNIITITEEYNLLNEITNSLYNEEINKLYNKCIEYINNTFDNIKYIYGENSNEVKAITILFNKTKNIIMFVINNHDKCNMPSCLE